MCSQQKMVVKTVLSRAGNKMETEQKRKRKCAGEGRQAAHPLGLQVLIWESKKEETEQTETSQKALVMRETLRHREILS